MAAKAPRNDAKTRAPADAPVAAPDESTATAGETSTAEAGSSPAGEAVSQEVVAPPGGDVAAAGPDAAEGPQAKLSSIAVELAPTTRASSGIELTPFERSLGLTDDPTEPLFSVCAPNGPRWRCGIQFGVSPKNMTGADLGAHPEAFWETLSSDPHLHVGPPIDTE